MKETILGMNSWVVYGGLLLLTVLIAFFLLSIASSLNKSPGSKTKKKKSSSRLGCLTILFLLLTAFALLSFSAYLRAYHAFTAQELVAMVECRPADADSADFRLILVPVIKEVPQEEQAYDMLGNQWAIGGDILKWHSAVNFLGLHTHYRLTRVEGRYA
ncbi:hypothetical protein JW992_04975, partial [candidate division KSB1 bacterium]|nr:hypothetical protein [candidate division KSB1 bacterium]